MRALISSSEPWPSTIVVSSLLRDDPARPAEIVERGVLELLAELLGDDLAAGQDGDVAEHLLAAVAEARRLDRQDVQDAAQLVDDQRAQRLAVDVLGDDDQLLAARSGPASPAPAACR